MILVTGATGFIGSHTSVELLSAAHPIMGFDNFINSSKDVLSKIEVITRKSMPFVQGDICDFNVLRDLFKKYSISAVIHFAALKSVGDSVSNPTLYYQNNLVGLLNLLKVMQEFKCHHLIFSSSATVYGLSNMPPFTENMPREPINPYGNTKFFAEEIISDFAKSWADFNYVLLRYFNPVGAHSSGMIGESPQGVPNNLMPYIADVAIGRREKLYVFGGDWPTVDGTGVRDYIHVQDLAEAHVAALNYLIAGGASNAVNIGCGRGYSVLEVVNAYELACGHKIPYEIIDKRPGDVAVSYADVSRAHNLLSWKAERELNQMCEDSWRWVNLNFSKFKRV